MSPIPPHDPMKLPKFIVPPNLEDNPEWKKIQALVQEQVERLARQESLVTDGFAVAFLDATGLKPDEVEMMIEEAGTSNHIVGEHKITRRIWFQPRKPSNGGCGCGTSYRCSAHDGRKP